MLKSEIQRSIYESDKVMMKLKLSNSKVCKNLVYYRHAVNTIYGPQRSWRNILVRAGPTYAISTHLIQIYEGHLETTHVLYLFCFHDVVNSFYILKP